MPRWAMVVLVVVLIGLGGMIVGIIYAGRWIRSSVTSLGKDAKEATETGTEYGKTHDANACVDESLKRLGDCKGVMCDNNVRFFLMSCFENASVPPGFCDRVPVTSEDIDKNPRWAYEECERRGWKQGDRCATTLMLMTSPCTHAQRTGT